MAKKKTELELIADMYAAYNKALPYKKNLLNTYKTIWYLEWYNIKEVYAWKLAISINRSVDDVELIAVREHTLSSSTIDHHFPLSDLNKTWFFTKDEAKATRNKLFKTKELKNDR